MSLVKQTFLVQLTKPIYIKHEIQITQSIRQDEVISVNDNSNKVRCTNYEENVVKNNVSDSVKDVTLLNTLNWREQFTM